jgi:hypothetical protein
MEEKPPLPANEGAGDASGPASTASAGRDEEKKDALETAAPSSAEGRDEKAETVEKAVAAAPEEPTRKKGTTALIMLAICVCKI